MSTGASPRFLFFDAVGTLRRPVPDVVTVYHQVGHAHGSRLTTAAIRDRFSQLYRVHFARDSANRETLRTSEQHERRRWQALVQELFAEVTASDQLFSALWEHFSQPRHWELYPDVPSAIEWLNDRGFAWGIASNFDRRLESIVADQPALAAAQLVITSASAGWSKPAAEFYLQAAQAAAHRLGIAEPQLCMIGDNPTLDVAAARARGWQAIWLERDQPAALQEGRIQTLHDLQFLLP